MNVRHLLVLPRALPWPSVLAAGLAACGLAACTGPTFVSLGRNTERVARPDAGAVSSCSESPSGDSLLSGCDEGPIEPLSCELAPPSVALDSACDTRRFVACPDSLSGDGARSNRLLSELLAGCTERSHYLTVLFNGGCASAFSLAPRDAPGADAASACVAARLGAERYPCAEAVDCGVGSTFGVPTSWVEPNWY